MFAQRFGIQRFSYTPTWQTAIAQNSDCGFSAPIRCLRIVAIGVAGASVRTVYAQQQPSGLPPWRQ